MYLTPTPGVDRSNLIETLRAVKTDLGNVRGRAHTRDDLRLYYFQWATEAVRLFRGKLRPHDLDTLVLTQRYWALQASTASTDVGALVEMEIDDQQAAIGEAIRALTEERDRELQRPGRVVVPDTNVFCEHPTRLEDLDFTEDLELAPGPVRVVIPIVVIDELDGLKQKGRPEVRGRARYTLAVLDRVLGDAGFGVLPRNDPDSDGVSVEVLLDPPGHARLPINDDEIVDRALALQGTGGRPVTLATYDTGMALRGRAHGLSVHKFRQQSGHELNDVKGT